MRFCSVASGSKGNSYIVQTDRTVILVDAGISGSKIVAGLSAMGISPEEVSGLLITHEHSDHAKSARIALKKCPNARLYTSQGTWDNMADRPEEDRLEIIAEGDEFSIGDIEVRTFPIHHDAGQPLGFSIMNGGRKLAIVTDTGFICENIMREMLDSHFLMLESNHDEGMLAVGRYPYHVKRRIAGNLGHLSNVATAQCLCDIYRASQGGEKRQVLLAHMSLENNTPDLALVTISSRLAREEGDAACMFDIEVAQQGIISNIYEV